ncbi:tryptophan--tRNA ligase [Candidatus Kaiserbacteria bacterium]|nr:tryptophan--tRNA ligase [Candidatus Kaiserbacteria bacterium]
MYKLFTGLQPSGALHIGNYFGALKPAVEMCREYDGMLMVADYHALTTLKDPKAMHENILGVVKDYVAAGLDPEHTIIFKQSDVPEHTELAWIFQCLVTVPFLELSHAYKDKLAKGLEANAGLFAYPMLMAADILLYDTDVVPVGEDQRQHLEYAREAAAKFNNTFGETFKEPREKILKSVAVVPGTDGKKMSKSYSNTIPLFGTKDEITKAVMSIVTDSKGELPENVLAIHRAFKSEKELGALYEANKKNYKVIKEALIADVEAIVAPMRDKRDSISDADAKGILKDGGDRARERASKKMADVRKKIGVSI